VPFARVKLAGTQDGTLDDNGRLAVLGTRIGLSFDRSRAEARLKEDRLVEAHMRVVFSGPPRVYRRRRLVGADTR